MKESMTERIAVTVRPYSDGDLAVLERTLGDPRMMTHLGGPESAEKLRDRHRKFSALSADPTSGCVFVILVGNREVAAGSVGYWEKEWQGQQVWETGWSVLPEFQGQGIATRATTAVVERARTEGKHRYIHAFPSVDNPPSNAVCRKVGFTLQGEYEFEYP